MYLIFKSRRYIFHNRWKPISGSPIHTSNYSNTTWFKENERRKCCWTNQTYNRPIKSLSWPIFFFPFNSSWYYVHFEIMSAKLIQGTIFSELPIQVLYYTEFCQDTIANIFAKFEQRWWWSEQSAGFLCWWLCCTRVES